MKQQKDVELRIPVDQCLAGEQVLIEENVDPKFLGLSEKDEIAALSPVCVSGKAYRAQEWLIVSANITAQFNLPCSTCNEDVSLTVNVPSFFHQEQLDAIEGGSWDMSAVLREAILLEIPFFVHCGGSSCKNFNDLKQYFRAPGADEDENTCQPFRDLL